MNKTYNSNTQNQRSNEKASKTIRNTLCLLGLVGVMGCATPVKTDLFGYPLNRGYEAEKRAWPAQEDSDNIYRFWLPIFMPK